MMRINSSKDFEICNAKVHYESVFILDNFTQGFISIQSIPVNHSRCWAWQSSKDLPRICNARPVPFTNQLLFVKLWLCWLLNLDNVSLNVWLHCFSDFSPDDKFILSVVSRALPWIIGRVKRLAFFASANV